MAAGIQADVDAVFPNLDCLTSEKLAATASRTAYVLKAGSQSCYEKTGLPGINKIIEGYHSKMNMFAEYVVTLSLFSLATMLKWKAFLLEGFVYRCRSFQAKPERMKANA